VTISNSLGEIASLKDAPRKHRAAAAAAAADEDNQVTATAGW